MNNKSMLGVLLLLGLCYVGSTARAWQDPKPFTKDEILSLVKRAESGPHEVTQGDIAVEVQRRGIDFAVDDKVIEEFRKAGARSFLLNALKHAVEEASRPHLDPREPDADVPDAAETKRRELEALARLPLIEQARYHALEFAGDLPNFVVNQVVNRYHESPGVKNWRLDDTLDIELTYLTGKGEQFKVKTIDGQPTTRSYSDLGGSTSTGEFGTTLTNLFAPQAEAEFKESKHDNLHGRETVVYDFTVKRVNSRTQITDKSADKGADKSVIAGYSGSVWIDTETKQVLRVEETNDDIPRGFPITLAEDAVDYDWVTISGERYLLPVHAEVLLGRDADRTYTKNVIEFRNYHKFEGDVKLIPDPK
jgi:hypothetical protein